MRVDQSPLRRVKKHSKGHQRCGLMRLREDRVVIRVAAGVLIRVAARSVKQYLVPLILHLVALSVRMVVKIHVDH